MIGVARQGTEILHARLLGPVDLQVDRAREVLRGWRDWADVAPDELSTGCVVIIAPPEPFVPQELHGKPMLGVPVLYVGDAQDGADAMRPVKDLGPAVDHVGPMPYTAFQAALDPLAPWGVRSYARGEYMSGLSDAAIETFLSRAVDLAALGAPLTQMVIFRIGQGVAAVPDEATAFSHRDARYLFHPIATWADPADDRGDPARSLPPCGRSARAPPTSTSPRRPTGSATVTATPCTPAWWRSRPPMAQPTCSGSPTTSAPVILPGNPVPA